MAQIILVSVQEISNVYKITCTGHSVLEVLPLALWMILLGLPIIWATYYVVPYSGNPKVRYDTVFRLGPHNINKSPFRCPYVVTPFGVAGMGKPRVKLLALAIPYSGNPKVRYDTVSCLVPFNINKSQFRCPCVVTPFGVAGMGKASREIACIGHSVLWEL